jgi:hypothetical protein
MPVAVRSGPRLYCRQNRHNRQSGQTPDSLDRFKTVWTDSRQSEQTPDKEVDIIHITVYVSGYIETDTTGMLSPNKDRMSGADKVVSFRADSLARYLLLCAHKKILQLQSSNHIRRCFHQCISKLP